MTAPPIFLLLAMAACSEKTSETGYIEAPSAYGDPIPLELTGLSPAYGLSGGGDRVVLTGGIFNNEATVSFGDDPGVVIFADSDSLDVRVPRHDMDALSEKVDISVSLWDQSATLPAAFSYWRDAEGELGLTGLIQISQTVGDYQPATTTAKAQLTFVDPSATIDPMDWWGIPLDSCVNDSDATFSYTANELDAQGATVRLVGTDGSTVDLVGTGGTYAATTIPGATADSGWLGLQVDGDGLFPPFEMSQLSRSLGPVTLLGPLIDAATKPEIVAIQPFVWGTTSADFVLIELDQYDSTGTSVIDGIRCMSSNNGEIAIDAMKLDGWVSGSALDIRVGLGWIGGEKVPYNQSENQVVTVFWMLGKGSFQ